MITFVHVKTCTTGTNGGAFAPLFCVDRSIFFSKSIIMWIGSVLAPLFLFQPRSLPAQIDCIGQPTIHLSRLQGTVFDPSGVPVPTVEISLVQDGQIVEKATTAEDGNFDLKAPAGNYELRVRSAYFRAIPLRIHLGTDFHTIFHPGELRWILEISGLNCSWATTSATAFDKEIQRFKERLKRDAQKNAT
jgi:Carboxypeptidase regulatory-like domain